MLAILVKPNELPEKIVIPDSATAAERLAIENALVGGPIDIIDPYGDDVILIVNDEGKNMGLPANRRINDRITIHGNFIVAGCDAEGHTVGLTQEQCEWIGEELGSSCRDQVARR